MGAKLEQDVTTTVKALRVEGLFQDGRLTALTELRGQEKPSGGVIGIVEACRLAGLASEHQRKLGLLAACHAPDEWQRTRGVPGKPRYYHRVALNPEEEAQAKAWGRAHYGSRKARRGSAARRNEGEEV